MPEDKETCCPRCGMSFKDNPPRFELELDFNKCEVRNPVFCSVCGANITSLPNVGRYGYSAMVSVRNVGKPPWEKK